MFSKIDWREIVNKGCGSRRWCSLAVASRCFSTLIVPRFSTLCGVVIHTTGSSCPHFRAVCTRLECRNWWSKEWVVENFTLTSRLKTRLAARPSGRDACGARPWLKSQKKCRVTLKSIAASWKEEWYHQESNRGHKDFQSFALPTELWHHLSCLREQK